MTIETDAFLETLKDYETLIGKNVCELCDRDIQKSIKVRCAECKPSFLMCLECHRRGVTKEDTKPEHKPNHAYFIHDDLKYPLLVDDWSARDEL